MQFPLRSILAGLSNKSGDDFCDAIVVSLQNSIASDYCYVARISPDKKSARTIAVSNQGVLAENFSYGLENTPCADVADASVCIFDRDICTHYPDDALLKELNIDGYIGTVLLSAKGEVLGLLVALYHQPVLDVEYVTGLFEIFSSRIAVEVERAEQELELRRVNLQLEKLIVERTQALEISDNRLERTQQELIQRDKMSAMGRIVAGMAHEMSTPIGVAMLANSISEGVLSTLQGWLQGAPMSKSQLQEVVSQYEEATTLMDVNLRTAGEQMARFKNIADGGASEVPEPVLVLALVQSIVDSFTADLASRQVKIHIDISASLRLKLPVSDFVQAFSHVLSNAIEHGFPNPATAKRGGNITVVATESKGTVVLSISDNGVGILPEHRDQIFEPFFTTRQSLKGSGLGLHIAYNTIVNKLMGSIQLSSDDPTRTTFVMTLANMTAD